MIKTEGLGNIPAKDIVEKMGISHQDDPKLEDATKEIYSKEFYEGILANNTKQFAGKKISEAKDEIKEWISKIGSADILLELTNSPVKCRCGAECVVKLLSNQWFLDYSNKDWKKKAHVCFEKMNILPNEIRSEFDKVLDWLRERACARQHGLGTKVPWDKEWLVESLADSVIYMAFYIISKYVNKKEINGNDLTDEFFDYVFYGKKDPVEISNKINITKEKLEEIRNEFLYFYPVDSRHSGRDLVPNHLTFFVLNHVALFPEENWPQEIVVNGSVLMAGKKMSKSMGNIIPLRDAVRKYGADPIRLTILISAELLQDADFNVEAIKGIKNKLASMYEDCTKTKAEKFPELEPEDKWIHGILQNLVLNAGKSMDEIRLREALHHILFDFDSELQWYLKRTKSKQRTNISGILHKILSYRVLMLSPFAPHIAEEMWEKLGHSGLVSQSSWPSVSDVIDPNAIQSEELLKGIMDDIANILKVTKITPKKITIYTADSFKSKAYHFILEKVMTGQTNMGSIMKELIANPETADIKNNPDFVQKTIKDVLSDPTEIRKTKLATKEFDEKSLISKELISLAKSDFGVDLQVYSENDSEIYDPKGKARHARPFKPAILIE